MLWKSKRRKDPEIAPDEIFLDASNTPEFDRDRFEGRLEEPLSIGTFVSLAITLSIIFLILVTRAWNLEITNGSEFAIQSAHNSLESTIIFARRGVITDVNGIVLAENVQKDEGLSGQDITERRYSLPALGQIIGYVSLPKKDAKGIYYDTKQTGLAGLEVEYDNVLAGKNGEILTEKDVSGRVRSEGNIVMPEDGKPLRLSIDANLEKAFARAISDAVESQNFIAGAGVIMSVDSGAVRAIVSYPSYDPNVMSSGGPSETIAKYSTDKGHPFLDHTVQGVYAPGSIVKPFIASGALTDGIITPNTVINDPGFISIPDPYRPGEKFVYTGWKVLGPVDVRKAIAWSSDIFFYTVGGGFGNQKGLGIDRLGYWYKQFGLGSKTGIDLPNEVSGLVPSPSWKKATFKESWYTGDTYFTAIGQYGTQVTPIQMVRATSAIANGGKLFTPNMIEGFTPIYTTVPVSSDALKVAREGMRQAVTDGTAGAINLSYIKVAAKTGTAQTGTRNQYNNSLIEGFFPYENPKYAFVVVLERGPASAGGQATNVMRQFFDSLYAQNSPYVGGNATTTQAQY